MSVTPVADDFGPARRDYSLVGPGSQRAVDLGLAAAEWYHTDVPRKDMKALMQRSDARAIRDTIIWFAALFFFAGMGIYLWPSPWSLLFFLPYGVLYGSSTDSRWHECGHGTAFKTQWMNTVVYQIACFMIMRNPVTWKWSHARHHTDTIIVGRDPEIAVMRPPDLLIVVLNFFGIIDAWVAMKTMVLNTFGVLEEEAKTYVPESEQPKIITAARIWFAIYAATIALAIYMGSILPLMVIGLPRLYGAWHMVMCGLLQHGGLADNVLDHRLNSRTVYMNPISRFIYWNMNYHVEHHMFPMVPYHALPRLHEMIKHDLPAPSPSIWAGYKEMVPAFLRQLRNEDYFIKRELPLTAKPYRAEFHDAVPTAAE
ncbi:MAG TPA: fatty acid desaturase family protein [Rhizobiaceae bacterium]|nr:fatty acid desaturase family protein [Rhizobiaceae bacterium]